MLSKAVFPTQAQKSVDYHSPTVIFNRLRQHTDECFLHFNNGWKPQGVGQWREVGQDEVGPELPLIMPIYYLSPCPLAVGRLHMKQW